MPKASFIEKVQNIKMPHRIMILLGTLVVLGGLFLFLIYIPKAEEIALIKAEIAGIEQQINQAKIREKNFEKFEAERADINTQFQEALTLLPDKREIPSLLRSITQLGSDSKLEFRLFQPLKERRRDFYVEIPVSMELSGSYHDVALFFDKVGRMERIVNIVDVSMKPIKERATTLITRCDAVTYRFKGKADESSEKSE
jgi:type IV pilus assembly protein PilO